MDGLSDLSAEDKKSLMDDALANIKGLDHSGIVGLDELGPSGAEDISDQAHI